MTKQCKACLFGDLCGKARGYCQDFSPIIEECTEEDLENYIESEREDFRERWFAIMDEEERFQEYFG